MTNCHSKSFHFCSHTNLDRTHSCQRVAKASAHLPLVPHTRGLQKKVPFPSKPAPFRKFFSIRLPRKDVSFFGNAWLFLRAGLSTSPLTEDLPYSKCTSTEWNVVWLSNRCTGTKPNFCVYTAQFNTAPRRWGPRINTAEFTLPGLQPLSFLTFQQGSTAQVQHHRSAQLLFLGLSTWSWDLSGVQRPKRQVCSPYSSSAAVQNEGSGS